MRNGSTTINWAWLLITVLLGACAAPVPVAREPETEPAREPQAELQVEILGNASISARTLKKRAVDDLILLEREGKAYQADDAAYSMEAYYREQGYHRARVDYFLEPGSPLGVRFQVSEEPRAVIEELALLGRGEVARRQLSPFFEGVRTGWLGGERIYVVDQVEEGARLVQAWYRSEGYLKARVLPLRTTFSHAGTRVRVEVEIEPGRRYFLRGLKVEGLAFFIRRLCSQELEQYLDRPFNTAWPRQAEKKIIALLRTKGYTRPEVDTEVEIDPLTGRVDVLFRADPGAQRRVTRICFSGQDRTEESLLHSYLRLEAGALFDGRRLNESTQALYRSGLFSSVFPEEIEQGENSLEIHYRVHEKEARDLSFLAGYGSYELLRGGVTYTDRNVLGRGLSWTSGIKASFRNLRGSTSLTDPLLFGLPLLRGTVEFSSQRRVFPAFTEKEYGAVISVSRPIIEALDATAGYSFSQSAIRHEERSFDFLAAGDRVTVGSLFTTWVRDTRDSRVMPRSGWLSEIKLETAREALGSEVNFNRFTALSSWLLPLEEEKRWVLAVHAKAGLIVRDGDTPDLPPQLRFYNGGEDSVRSFKQDELGFRVNGDAVGGEYFSTGNLELRFPLSGRWGGALFADAGNVILRRADVRFRHYRYALGLGVRYDLPIGPVRLDWGWNPNRRSGEDLWALHLGVGFAF